MTFNKEKNYFTRQLHNPNILQSFENLTQLIITDMAAAFSAA